MANQGFSRLPPRTATITTFGACNHRFTNKQKVPDYIETSAHYEEWRRETIKEMHEGDCPVCAAQNGLTRIRHSVDAFAGWLKTDALPHFDGESPALVLRAENARYATLQSLLSLASSETQGAFRSGLAGGVMEFFLEGARSLFPNEPWSQEGELKEEPYALAHELIEKSRKVTESGYQLDFSIFPSTALEPRATLAVWLRLRDVWLRCSRLHLQSNSKYWSVVENDIEAVAYFHTTSESIGLINVSTVMAAVLTASLDGWGDEEAAWDFYKKMCDPRIATTLRNSGWKNQALGIVATVESAAVVAALSDKNML